MPLSSADIIFRAALVANDSGSNGGRMKATILASALKNALFPDVRQSERTTGSDKWRKVFLHFAPPDPSQALDVKVVPWAPTAAQDRVRLHVGTQTDEQTAIIGTPGRAYGAANTVAGALAPGAETIDVQLESASETIFVAGDVLYVTDKDDITSLTGAEEYVELSSVSVSGTVATLTLAAPLSNAYSVSGSTYIRVASVLALGDVLPAAAAGTVTSSAGTFDAAQLVVAPRSAIADTWTLTFVSAIAYTMAGDATGAVSGSGSVSGSFAPSNADFGGPYVTIPAAAFGGTYATGDTVTFTTTPAARGLWLRRIVPAGAASFAANRFTLMVDCESA
ncbi:MAG: hypothetical protein KIS62_12470 [Ramlibacter sp.]|nr:hypothetical protein [Ramlibacter sp.]MCW5650553.1 hypothetical protein [Ramlibacter sp.]